MARTSRTSPRSITTTPRWAKPAAPPIIRDARITGRFEMTFNHKAGYDANGNWFGSIDYIAFDYFELNAEVAPVPEPGTLVLFGLGLAGLAAWKRLRV